MGVRKTWANVRGNVSVSISGGLHVPFFERVGIITYLF